MNHSRARLVVIAFLAAMLLVSPLAFSGAQAEGDLTVTASSADSGVIDTDRDGVAEISRYGRRYRSLSLGEQGGQGRDLRYVAPVTMTSEQRSRINAGASARLRISVQATNHVDGRSIVATALAGGLTGTYDYRRSGVHVATFPAKLGLVNLDVTSALRSISGNTVTFRLQLSQPGSVDRELTKVDIATVESKYRSTRPALTVSVPPSTTTAAPVTTTAQASTTTTAAKATTTTAAPTTTTTAASEPTSPSGFVHPGVLVDRAQLDFVKAKIAAGAEPWKSALNRAMSSGSSVKTAARPSSYRYSSLSYPAAPVSVIRAPSSSDQAWLDAHPDYPYRPAGDLEHLDDARAAYTHALIWYYTGNQANADKAKAIMDAWSAKLTKIEFDVPTGDGQRLWDNGKLEAGWAGSLFARAAEIIRYSGAGWSSTSITRFENLLTNVYLPLTITGWSNGANWLMTFAEATISIGVFTNDRDAFNAGVAYWRAKTPTTIYLPADGSRPLPPHPAYDTAAEIKSLWYNPSSYISGLQTETSRDLSHMTMGLGAMINGAETARIQGVDLYREQQTRIIAGYELNARFINEYLDRAAQGSVSSTWRPTGWVSPSFKLGGTYYQRGWDIAYNHYVKRLGINMPQTQKLALRTRNQDTAALHMTWETLTHTR